MNAEAKAVRENKTCIGSMLLDTMLPNRGFSHRVNAIGNSRTRSKYWALRIGLAFLLVLVGCFLDLHQYQQLR